MKLFPPALIVLTSLLAAPAFAQDDRDDIAAYERGDSAAAPHEWRALAARGDGDAQASLGLSYARGQGVSRDYGEAVRWFRLSAERGSAIGQNNLAFMYRNGHGVRQDYAIAVMLYRLSAAQGYALAQGSLGVMYQNGDGIRRDTEEAYMWYTLAAEQGHAGADRARLSLERLMSAEQKAAALARVRDRKQRETRAGLPAPSGPADSAPPPEIAAGAFPETLSAPLSALLSSPAQIAAKIAAVPPAESAVVKPPASAGGAPWKVQLASLREQTKAEAEWQRLQHANRDLLHGLLLHVQQATLSKGTFYRVQAGPLADRASAASLCHSLKSRNQDCLIVVP